jgi:cobaltochelatase CobS
VTTTYAVGPVQPFPVGPTFGIKVPKGFTVEGFADDKHPFIPPKKPYVFRKDQLRDVLAFLERPRGDGLYIVGPTGAGKSSIMRQTAARLNWPVQEVNCHRRLELTDLIGQFKLVNGSMQFMYGPAAIAIQDGHILILNEVDFNEPGEIAGLNAVLDGAPLVIAENGGEVIRPHTKFRLVVTGNSAGQGDQSGLYQGILQQNVAFLDRFRFMETGYMEDDEETQLLGTLIPDLPEEIRKRMVKVANEVRRLFVGDDKNPGTVSTPISTRGVQRWAYLALDFKSAPNALEYALERTVLLRASPEEREALVRIAKDVFGEMWGVLNEAPKPEADTKTSAAQAA